MDRTFTTDVSEKLSESAETELIKLAGLLDGEEWEAVKYYLSSLQTDVNDDVIKRIVRYSRNYRGTKMESARINN